MNPNYRKSTLSDALYVAKNLRAAARQEINGLGYTSGVIPWTVLNSDDTITFFDKDHPENIMGVAGVSTDPNNPRKGIIWMLCTPHINTKPLRFVREAKIWLAEVESKYQYLWNLSDARNHLHHKFLKMMGFRSISTVYPAPHYLPYLPIVKLCAPPQQL